MTERAGTLIAIGGHEDKEGDRVILRSVAERLRGGRLVVATVASHEPEGYFEAYRSAFAAIGVADVAELYLDERHDTLDSGHRDLIGGAAGIFFTGGDQLRIVSQMGDTPLEALVRELHARGGVVAGTSAGASAQSETMLVRGSGAESHRIGDLHMAPGLGLIPDVIIDQHFAERGRIGRLLGAVAHNPQLLGIGIDEDSAIVVEGTRFSVIGSGAVTVVDAGQVTHSNIAEAEPDRVLSMHHVVLHALSAGDHFDLAARSPSAPAPAE
ncbi:cyanophycinase [Sphingopyxis sp. OAS728]|uniref:cyanophycinase n=1 Tax=Sphingopyxis sp. OAS728 TaxID=2663823 RepID=UPI00178B3701|nr:cyanophycinase [Sphingopyxis sp. OAS728]MBE1529466.1 cyanophycinase [Sphingopyxis sp. OAS728]